MVMKVESESSPSSSSSSSSANTLSPLLSTCFTPPCCSCSWCCCSCCSCCSCCCSCCCGTPASSTIVVVSCCSPSEESTSGVAGVVRCSVDGCLPTLLFPPLLPCFSPRSPLSYESSPPSDTVVLVRVASACPDPTTSCVTASFADLACIL